MVALSFDLYIWCEHGAVSADDARAKLQRRGEAGVFAAHPAVERFWSRSREVGAAIRALAAEHGLVCYDPQADSVDPNAPGYVPWFTTLRCGAADGT